MKNKIIIFLLLSTTIFAQLVEPLPVEITQQSQINYQIYQLQKEIDKQFNEDIKNGLEPEIIKIDKKNVIIKDNKAIVNIDVYSNTSNNKRVLKNQELVFTKNNSFTLEKHPQILEQTIKRSVPLKKSKTSINTAKSSVPNKTTSGEIIDIRLSDNVIIPYPLFQNNNSDIYEIDFKLTKDSYDIQLFSAGADVDGCVYYDSYISESVFKRVSFYVDPDWKRIMFSRDEDGTPGEIRGFWGDENVRFERPVAIDVNENGEIFVLDAEAKTVFKLQYDWTTNSITTTSGSVLINSTYLNNPSDLSYSNGGSPGATNVHFLAITDLEDKSIKTFNYNGALLNTYTEYAGSQISKPKRIVTMPSISSLYKRILFIDDNRIVRADLNNNNTMNASVSDDFPLGSNLSDIGITSSDYGSVESVVVSDKGKNMLHLLDANATYNCSYKGPTYEGSSYTYMIAPLRIFKTAWVHQGISTKVKLDFYTMDMWSRVRGIKKFVPGADVINISVTRGTFKWILHKYETNRQLTNIKIVDVATGSIISYGSEYAFDSDLIAGRDYKWVIEYKPFYDNYYVGYEVGWKTKEITFTHNLTMPTYIEGSYAISGAYTSSANVDVSIWGSLTLNAGASITFQNGASLIVNGTLEVDGTSSNKATFDFVAQNATLKNGIKVNTGGTAIINNAIIKNAYNGVYVDEAVVNVNNCEIFNCYYGIHLYRTNYVSYPSSYITNTNSHDNEYGVVMYYSIAHLSYNQFNNNFVGVGCADYSSPYLADNDNLSESSGHNNIHHNDYGVFAYAYSNPFLGRETCVSYGGYNILAQNNYDDLHSYGNCTIYAENNWWGAAPPIASQFYLYNGSTLDYTPYLTSVPQMSQNKIVTPEEEIYNIQFKKELSKSDNSTSMLKLSSSDKPSGFDKGWPIEWKLLYARNLMRVKKHSAAAAICENVIADYPDSSLSYLALDLLHQSRVKEKNKTKFSQFVKEKASKKVKKQIYGVAELLLAGGEKNDRVAVLNGIAKNYKDTPLVEFVLFQKFMFYLYEENDLDLAKTTSEELGTLFPKSESYFDSQRHLGIDVKRHLSPQLAKANSEETVAEIPDSYELLGNYPNPFNPSTTISYALPYNSNVELTIYDITGKVVKIFNENVQSAGYQNIIWNGNNQNGSRVSSGVYFYRFKASSIENNGKVFEKSAKMLLIK